MTRGGPPSRTVPPKRAVRCLGGLGLEHPALDELLAVDAEARPGHRLQTLGVDRAAAVAAPAVGPLVQTPEGVLDLEQPLPLTVREREHQLPVVVIVRAVDDVLGAVVRRLLAGADV